MRSNGRRLWRICPKCSARLPPIQTNKTATIAMIRFLRVSMFAIYLPARAHHANAGALLQVCATLQTGLGAKDRARKLRFFSTTVAAELANGVTRLVEDFMRAQSEPRCTSRQSARACPASAPGVRLLFLPRLQGLSVRHCRPAGRPQRPGRCQFAGRPSPARLSKPANCR